MIIFYLFYGIIFISTLLVIFGIMSVRNQVQLNQNIYKYLRIFFNLVLTVVYIPTIYCFAKMVSCKERAVSTSQLIYVKRNYLDLYPNVVCWENTHIIHAVCAISGLIFIIFSGLISSLFFFDGTGQFNSANSKKSSIGNACLIIYETVMCLAFAYLVGTGYQSILIGIFLFGAAVVLYYVYIQRPFFNQRISLAYSISIIIVTWTGIMLLMALVHSLCPFLG